MNVDHMDRVKKNDSHDADCCCLRVCMWLYERLCVFQDASRLPRVHVFVFFLSVWGAANEGVNDYVRSWSWHFPIDILNPPFTFHIWTCHQPRAPCERPGWIKVSLWLYATLWTRQAGRQEVLNPRLERSRSQAAGKLSSVPPSASQLSPLSYLGDQAWCHVMVDIIALSSIYLFPSSPSLGWK